MGSIIFAGLRFLVVEGFKALAETAVAAWFKEKIHRWKKRAERLDGK